MKIVLATVILFLSLSSFAQEFIIKAFAETRRDVKLCLYPSTLGMINVSKDSEYNALVGGVEKLLIYTLDSATVAKNQYTNWIREYLEEGYEEYIAMSGPRSLTILGKKKEFVGLTRANGSVIAFYLRGIIEFQKIPKLIQTFESGDILGILTDQFNE